MGETKSTALPFSQYESTIKSLEEKKKTCEEKQAELMRQIKEARQIRNSLEEWIDNVLPAESEKHKGTSALREVWALSRQKGQEKEEVNKNINIMEKEHDQLKFIIDDIQRKISLLQKDIEINQKNTAEKQSDKERKLLATYKKISEFPKSNPNVIGLVSNKGFKVVPSPDNHNQKVFPSTFKLAEKDNKFNTIFGSFLSMQMTNEYTFENVLNQIKYNVTLKANHEDRSISVNFKTKNNNQDLNCEGLVFFEDYVINTTINKPNDKNFTYLFKKIMQNPKFHAKFCNGIQSGYRCDITIDDVPYMVSINPNVNKQFFVEFARRDEIEKL